MIKHYFNKFRIFMFVYWGMILSVTGMYTMYLTKTGFSKEEISIAVSVYTFSSLLGQSFIGYIVDKFGTVKKVMFLFLSTGLIVGAFINYTKSHLVVFLLLFIWAFCISGTVPLSEAWCIDTLSEFHEQKNFGKIRGFGSIGYGFSGVLIGLLLQNLGWKIYNWYILISVLFTLLVVLSMSDKGQEGENTPHRKIHKASSNISVKEALREIFKVKPLISIIVVIFMYNFVVRGIYSYLGVLVSDFGGGPLSLGFTYFFDASPEIITFFLTAKLLKKFQAKNLILGSFFLQIIRLSVILIFNNALAVMLMGVMSGLAFGLLAASYKTYIYELAPAKYKASCMSVSETIIGLSGIISAPIFGFMFARFGINTTITTGLVIYIAIILFLLRNIIFLRKRGLG